MKILYNELSMRYEFNAISDFFENCSMYKQFSVKIKMPQDISYTVDEVKTKEMANIKKAIEERLKQEGALGNGTYYIRDYLLSEYCNSNTYFELDGFVKINDGKLYKFTYISDYYQRPTDQPSISISSFEEIFDDDAANIYYFDRIKALTGMKNSITVQ